MKLWFGCAHEKTTFPISRAPKVRQLGRLSDTYIVCLDCGREMPYSWSEMRVVKERRSANSDAEELFAPPVAV
jgi:hypothetical protein